MFTKLLIANRGEIACRVAATARRLGVRTVAVYADPDANAMHVAACDEAVRLGGAAPRDSYLRIDRVIEAARTTGAQAIHPGYGFLSENAAFAQSCADAGIVFVGPPPAAIKAMGLKAESKRLMGEAGVPLVPGYHGADQAPDLLQREADRIGYPVLIKASAGGGGKGMRIVPTQGEFAAALASCQREAINSFGDAAVLIERYLTRPRHIEIQVFADAHGNCVHLFERDCSVQRRHQKVLEEAPAPGMSAARRGEMGAAAIAAARAVAYVGAGTVEFIAEPAGDGADPNELRFYFMEMNTRLQVEHPVTEAITGLDLVEWQLRIAAGEPLPRAQSELRIAGHAIEARLCAENPAADFLPATGRLAVFRAPPEAVEFRRGDVRLDAGVREGDTVLPYYDPMFAKLIVHGADRAEALARLDAALGATHILGLHTNVAFLRRVVRSASFAGADLDTALIERERAALFGGAALAPELAAAGVVAWLQAEERATETADPWSRRSGWRLAGAALRVLELEVGGVAHRVVVERRAGAMTLAVGAQRWAFAWQRRDGRSDGGRADADAAIASAGAFHITLGEQATALSVYAMANPRGRRFGIFAPDGSAIVDELTATGRAPTAPEAGGLAAPMPGRVVAFLAGVGDAVQKGQPLAVLEAMKMEHTIAAPRDGTVAELLYAVGDQVGEGGELLRLAAAG